MLIQTLPFGALFSSLLFTSVNAQSAIDVNVANVPDCAKVCLSNSTQYATDCAQIDVKCLCSSPSYVSALSCCLATNCNSADQQTAIQFNIQECAAVNSTAPNFVGCSPFSLTTGAISKQSTAASTASGEATTISGNDIAVPTAYTNTRIGTATYAGSALLTGTCSVPMFAEVTNSAGGVVQFPQVGCALNRGNCCPFEPNEYFGVTKCPQDYTTISGGCCPSGYSVYSSAIGAETPCFSKPTKAYLPASTASGTQVSLITNAVFSRKYALVRSSSNQLPGGAIAGIVIGSFACAVGLPGLIILLLRRYRRKQEALITQLDNSNLAYPSTDPAVEPHQQMSEARLSGAPQSPQELASPETMVNTPTTMKGQPFSSPGAASILPAYEVRAISTPAEMPGSTYIHEHHPAHTGYPSPHMQPRSASSTVGTGSPMLSPATPYRTDSPSNVGSITPLGSPSLSPRFREGAM